MKSGIQSPDSLKVLVVGAGAVGSVLAAILAKAGAQVTIIQRSKKRILDLERHGISLAGTIQLESQFLPAKGRLPESIDEPFDLVFFSMKAFDLTSSLESLRNKVHGSTPIVLCQNGIGFEQATIQLLPENPVYRLIVNFGCMLKSNGVVELRSTGTANVVGALNRKQEDVTFLLSSILSKHGFSTIPDKNVNEAALKKTIINSAMAVCCLRRATIGEALEDKETRTMMLEILHEGSALARSMGHSFGEQFVTDTLAYWIGVAGHTPSIVADLNRESPTEIKYFNLNLTLLGSKHGVQMPMTSHIGKVCNF